MDFRPDRIRGKERHSRRTRQAHRYLFRQDLEIRIDQESTNVSSSPQPYAVAQPGLCENFQDTRLRSGNNLLRNPSCLHVDVCIPIILLWHYKNSNVSRTTKRWVRRASLLTIALPQLIDNPETGQTNVRDVRRYDIPLVHDVELVKSVGVDGEYSSGGIELLDVQKTGSKTPMAAIRSRLSNNETGLPVLDTSWSIEFNAPDEARLFWQGWKPNFDSRSAIDALRTYVDHRRNENPNGSIRFRALGELLPWYLQREGDQTLLDRFSTFGSSLVGFPEGLAADENYVVGRVYRVPEFHRCSYEIKAWNALTCLGSVRVPQRTPDTGWYSSQQTTDSLTLVQWSDGSLNYPQPDPGYQAPLPMRRRDLVPHQ